MAIRIPMNCHPTGTLTTSPDLIWETTAGGAPYQSESISAGTGWSAPFGDGSLAFELIPPPVIAEAPHHLLVSPVDRLVHPPRQPALDRP